MAVVESVAEMSEMDLQARLDQLDRDGFLLIEGALSPAETERCRARINFAREQGWEEGLNEVGNMWFDRLLEQDPETFCPLIAHPSVRPYLEALLGPQCQLRSLRAHINPGAYLQEWHMDFYGYWRQPKRRLTVPPGLEPELVRGYGMNEFRAWCDRQEHVILYPKAGDCVLFYSHIPHQGAKVRDHLERSNVVCHYQCTPMYEGIWHVSRPIGYQGTFPLAG
jgi:hypothetical protein